MFVLLTDTCLAINYAPLPHNTTTPPPPTGMGGKHMRAHNVVRPHGTRPSRCVGGTSIRKYIRAHNVVRTHGTRPSGCC